MSFSCLAENNRISSREEGLKRDPFVDFFYCPFSKTPLTEAMNLYPCAHVVNEIVVKQLKDCPVCNTPIDMYSPALWIRNVTQSFFSLDIEKILPEIRAKSAMRPSALNKIPYPAEKQRFGFDDVLDQWYPNGHDTLSRWVQFYDEFGEGWFTRIAFGGSYDGSLLLTLRWRERDNRVIYSYFRALGIDVEKGCGGGIGFDEIETIRDVYAILQANHEFSPEWKLLLDQVIEAGDWRKIP